MAAPAHIVAAFLVEALSILNLPEQRRLINIQVMPPSLDQKRRALRHGALALAVLACMQLSAVSSQPMPRMPPEEQPAAWQRAGIEAALADPDFGVRDHALDYCRRKQWVAQIHLPTAQWLLWLGLSDQEMHMLAAQAVGQLGAQVPPEVQRALAHLQNDKAAGRRAQGAATQALGRLGSGMIPEVQLEMVAFLQSDGADILQQLEASKALGDLGAAMAPATLEALLSLMKKPQASYAANALAHLGTHMPPQLRQAMLAALLDAHADSTLRIAAVGAMGRLGPQMPAQAQQFLLSVLRDPTADRSLRYVVPAALARLGAQMPPEVQQALLAVYDETPPVNADEDTRNSHLLFHQQAREALVLAGPEMPPALQQGLLDRFLKAARTPPQALPSSPKHIRDMMERSRLGAELSIMAQAGAHPSPAFLRTVLAEFLSPTLSNAAQESLAWHVLQPLAKRGELPPEVQRALLASMQDEKARLETRRQAAHTLGCLGADASPEAKKALLAILQDQNQKPTLRYHALLAMQALGPHMPPEATPVLVGILQRNTHPPSPPIAKPKPAPATFTGPDPFGPIIQPPANPPPPASTTPAPAPPATDAQPPIDPPSAAVKNPPAASLEADDVNTADEFPIEIAVPALGNLGEKMSPEAQTALLGVIQHGAGPYQTRWDAALSLAQMGDKLPPHTQQRLIAMLDAPELEYEVRLAIYRTLGVSGIHPASDAQVAELLAKTYAGGPDAELRFYLHLWLGRNPAHLQAVRWLGSTQTDPPLGDTPPQEILTLISRLWPHNAGADAGHTALRHAMARRTSLFLTTHLKSHPLDEPLRKALLPLATQLATDPAPDCATALQDVQAALKASEKAR
ncbi:MAG: hypothetical protein B7Z37_23125 [Verrucomicrobia bacterium 12-59-8]|nr:MAG: hypothetical protein B7Z37_23125 [Verrucomicrobia bacterium 12-59-8]